MKKIKKDFPNKSIAMLTRKLLCFGIIFGTFKTITIVRPTALKAITPLGNKLHLNFLKRFKF